MSFNISQDTVDIRTGDVHDQFLYFSRPVTIHQEPIQNVISEPENFIFGYSADSQTTDSQITYTPVYDVFSGLIIYPFKAKSQSLGMFDNKLQLNPNNIYLKVRKDARDYIKTGGKVEKIEADEETWNLVEGFKVQQQNYLGLKFYYFEVKGTT